MASASFIAASFCFVLLLLIWQHDISRPELEPQQKLNNNNNNIQIQLHLNPVGRGIENEEEEEIRGRRRSDASQKTLTEEEKDDSDKTGNAAGERTKVRTKDGVDKIAMTGDVGELGGKNGEDRVGGGGNENKGVEAAKENFAVDKRDKADVENVQEWIEAGEEEEDMKKKKGSRHKAAKLSVGGGGDGKNRRKVPKQEPTMDASREREIKVRTMFLHK